MTTLPAAAPWSGTWVAARLGVRVEDRGGAVPLQDLVGLALRRNPRRAHLLVSPVLGKHVPVAPRKAVAAGRALGRLVAARLDAAAEPAPAAPLRIALAAGGPLPVPDAPVEVGFVLGYAETATGLGHLVADVLRAPYLHSTRRDVSGTRPALGFEEAHSHATSHRLVPADDGLLDSPGPVVLVDDELSTGATVVRTIEALQRRRSRGHYVVACLVDVRDDADRERADDAARRLGCRIDVVALATGRVLPAADALTRGAALVARLPPASAASGAAAPVVRIPVPLPLVEGGRHGFGDDDRRIWRAAVPHAVDALAAALPSSGRVHVLGTEEFMAWPLAVALGLERARPRARVTCSSTTRSPVAPVDDPGYAVRDAIAFPAHDAPADGLGPRYAYNLASLAPDVLVVLTDRAGATPAIAGLLDAVAATAGRVVVADAAR